MRVERVVANQQELLVPRQARQPFAELPEGVVGRVEEQPPAPAVEQFGILEPFAHPRTRGEVGGRREANVARGHARTFAAESPRFKVRQAPEMKVVLTLVAAPIRFRTILAPAGPWTCSTSSS